MSHLMHRIDDPVYSRVTANCFVLRVDENNFEVFVGGILINPIGIEDPEIGATSTNALFSSRLEGSLVFELIHTLIRWLACEVD